VLDYCLFIMTVRVTSSQNGSTNFHSNQVVVYFDRNKDLRENGKWRTRIDKLFILLYTIMLFLFEDFLFGEATKQEKGGYHTYIEKTGLTCMSGLLLVRARLIKHEENNTAVDSRIKYQQVKQQQQKKRKCFRGPKK
jgi:hypothetical protein